MLLNMLLESRSMPCGIGPDTQVSLLQPADKIRSLETISATTYSIPYQPIMQQHNHMQSSLSAIEPL